MRITTLFFICVTTPYVLAASIEAESAGPRSAWSAHARAGYVLESPDPALLSTWKHQTPNSHQISIGGNWHWPTRLLGVQFYFGGEFNYLRSREELSGVVSASIEVELQQLMGVAGVSYSPEYFGGRWGGAASAAFEIWGQKTADLDSKGFTQDLGTEKTYARRRGFALYPPAIIQLSVFYQWNRRWRPLLAYDRRGTGQALTLGAAYVF